VKRRAEDGEEFARARWLFIQPRPVDWDAVMRDALVTGPPRCDVLELVGCSSDQVTLAILGAGLVAAGRRALEAP